MDAKLGFDDNADFRQEDVFSLRDISQEEPSEVEAQKANLNFIKLDGSIGCLEKTIDRHIFTMQHLPFSSDESQAISNMFPVHKKFQSVTDLEYFPCYDIHNTLECTEIHKIMSLYIVIIYVRRILQEGDSCGTLHWSV